MTCEVCGHDRFHPASVTRSFTVDDKLYVVEGIPAEVCDRCGAHSFRAEIADRLRRLIHEPHPKGRIIPAEVLEFHAA